MHHNDQIIKSPIPLMNIRFDLDWEARNWYKTVTVIPKFGLSSGKAQWGLGDIPKDFAEKLRSISDEDEAVNIIKNYIQGEFLIGENKMRVDRIIQDSGSIWSFRAEKYFVLLSKMLQIPIEEFEKEYNSFFTFSTRCPFFENSFMFNRRLNFFDNAAHEIMHIEFLKKYAGFCLKNGLSDKQLDHLKEILTVLLNEDMKESLSKPDPGYTKHLEIRKKVLEIYCQNKEKEEPFIVFLEKIINIVKEIDF